jgi:DNA invertase Pin-like site-specific DNA recombinase|tara:strand:- start:937 stop:1530 length:594 start_codon:yes stop_codon:yes gene_type:complete
MTAAIYARVSTKEQNTDNQVLELKKVAEKAGWEISNTFIDHGISGSKGRKDRPALDTLLKTITRRETKRVLVWSVDRLGRSLQDLISTLNEINSSGAELYIHQQAIDTGTSSGRMLFSMLGVFAEFEREMISERVSAGLERAKANGVKLGRKRIPPITERKVIELSNKGLSQRKVATRVNISQQKVSMILREHRQVA